MSDFFSQAKFITTEFDNYFSSKNLPWGQKKPKLYQHTDLVPWKGLPMFLKDFEIDSVEDAKLYFTSLGCIDIYINGKRLEGAEMKPGWSTYNKRALYMCKDVSSMLTVGKNRILAVVSTGWYTGRIAGGIYGEDSPAAMLSLVCGGKTVAATDESWLCTVGGQIKTADIWDGEYRDGREDNYTDISKTDYELKDWENAEIYDYKGEVTPFIGSEVKVRDGLSLKPQKITISDGIVYNGTHYGKIHVCEENSAMPFTLKIGQKVTLDMGQETVGWLKIKVKAPEGTEIKMRYAEFLNDSGDMNRGNDGPEGSVYTINLRSALGKAFYVAGGDVEEYKPVFTFFGYRFVEICADNEVEIFDLTAEVVGNDNIETGKIETSHPMVNKLFSNALWGQRSNYLSVPTDCPQRDERLGWTGDAQAFSTTAAYNANVYGFFRKWMQDMRDNQGETGAYADVNPRVGCCSSEDACAWGDAGVIIPYNLYKIYGDGAMIKEHFDSMDKYVTGLVDKYGYSGPIPRYGDWLAYDWCDNKFISSAYFVRDIDMMIEMCAVAGREDRKDYYKDLRVKAYEFFCDNFMKDGVPVEKTQCNKIIALAFGLIEKDKEPELAEALAQQIKDNGDRLSCGFLGTYNLCPTLSKFGKDKTAYNLLLQRNEPSWFYSIDQGATTIWERWNSYTKENGFGDVGMNSFNHYAYGAIVEWMYRYMAGIEPVEAGFGTFTLCPRIDMRTADEMPEGQENIKWVKAEFNSVKGLIKSEWNTENGLTYKCTVPEGTKAFLTLPAVSDKVTVNGNEFSVTGEKYEAELDAGEYTFVF
ncbi:MAG: glycoside hydrolase family 78 protein [Clostridia bacterium]|nr:glycoside hydrolase family 78 protein [Clostridia bacterium]